MTFIQPFASPEVDLEGMRPTAFICLLPSDSSPHSLYFPTLSFFFSSLLHATSFSFFLLFFLFLSRLHSKRVARQCKSSQAVFFCWPLISADDVSKEVKGDNSEATAAALLYSTPPDLCLPLSLFFSLPPALALFSYHIFNIINIDRAMHLEPLFNNCLLRLLEALMASAHGRRDLKPFERFMQFRMNNPQMSRRGWGLSRACGGFIDVTVIPTHASSRHRFILSSAKCLLYIEFS